MADNYNIYKICTNCSGKGFVKNYTSVSPTVTDEYATDCGNCEGTGKYLWGEMLEQE